MSEPRPHQLTLVFNLPVGVPLTLSHCPELRLLQICATIPGKLERAVISSIISTNIRTIIFTPQLQPRYSTLRMQLEDPCWLPLDDALCMLVAKLRMLGYDHTLELEFRLDPVNFDLNLDPKGFLPKFRERGCVRVLHHSCGRALEISVRFFVCDLHVVVSDLCFSELYGVNRCSEAVGAVHIPAMGMSMVRERPLVWE